MCRQSPSTPKPRTPTRHRAFLRDASAGQTPPARARPDQCARGWPASVLETSRFSLSALIDRLAFTRLGATDRPKDPKIHFAINRDCGQILTGIFFMPDKSVGPTD